MNQKQQNKTNSWAINSLKQFSAFVQQSKDSSSRSWGLQVQPSIAAATVKQHNRRLYCRLGAESTGTDTSPRGGPEVGKHPSATLFSLLNTSASGHQERVQVWMMKAKEKNTGAGEGRMTRKKVLKRDQKCKCEARFRDGACKHGRLLLFVKALVSCNYKWSTWCTRGNNQKE